MATVPNYYYNSPWIAEVGRNLASALKPPDIDTLQARERNAWQFEYSKTKAENEATDRTNSELSRRAIGDMYELQKNPIRKADGTIDEAATEKRAFELADEAMTYGPKDVRAEVDEGLFNLSPNFARKRIIQRETLNAQDARLTRSLAGAITLAREQGGIRGGLQNDQQEFELMKMREMYALRGKELQQRAYLKAKAANMEPITITPALADRMWLEILKFEKTSGNPLTPEDRFALLGEATELAQTSRNPITAVHERWNIKFPYAQLKDIPTQEVQEPGIFDNWLGNTDPYLKPVDTPAAPAAPATPFGPLLPQDAAPRSMSEGIPLPAAQPDLSVPDEVYVPPQAANPPPASAREPTKPAGKGVQKKRAPDGRMLPAPMNKAERDSLPSGTDYIAPTDPPTVKTKK